ncbi:MAG: DEAD/DEAH box helicase [Treponema sp.]|nr:DEAD/DEAH box helicase [Treponema sp.]
MLYFKIMLQDSIFLQFSDEIQEKLKSLNITTPTSVQQNVIPTILENKNVIFQSETGTGKTFTYLLPIIKRIYETSTNEGIKAIICAPTFELASQIKQAAMSVTSLKTALFIGGAPIKRQIESLKEKPQIIVGTTARLLELIKLKKIKTNNLFTIVFDESDRLIKKETIEDVYDLLKVIPQTTQIIACSATIDEKTKKVFTGEVILMPQEDVLKKNITHWAIYAEQRNKIDTLRKVILAEKPEKALIFTSRADQVENIYSKLTYKNIDCVALHAKADKQKRKSAIDKFKSGKIKYLITSDLAARGLDIPGISHVIQMDLPSDNDFFVHRAGRTARAGKKGINIVIGDEYEMNKYALLEKKLGIIVYPKEIYNGKITEPSI